MRRYLYPVALLMVAFSQLTTALDRLPRAKGPSANLIDPVLAPYYESFITAANASGSSIDHNQGLTLVFGKLRQPIAKGVIVGLCSGYHHVSANVTIDIEYWMKADRVAKLLLVYHELGHCVLDKYHSDKPMSIMNGSTGAPISFIRGPNAATNLAVMIKELFDKDQ